MQENLDVEVRRLRDVYAAMGDGELLTMARQRSELTGIAQESLDAVMKERGLAAIEAPATSAGVSLPTSAAADDVIVDGFQVDGRTVDDGWIVLWASPLVAQIQKAADVLEAHDVPFRLRADPLQQGVVARTNEMGRMYLSVEVARRAEAEGLLKAHTDLFTKSEVVDARYAEDTGSDTDLFSVGLFEDAADLSLAEQALRDAGIWFASSKEAFAADPDAGTPASEAMNVEVKSGDAERAVEVLDRAFAEVG